MVFLNKVEKTEKLKKKLIYLVANHPEQIKESHDHRPGETYVVIDGKRVYFAHNSLPKITAVYKRNNLYGAYREVKKFFRDAYNYQYWLHLFRPTFFFPILYSSALLYFCFIEPNEIKIHRFEKLCSIATGFKSEYIGDGKIKLSGIRKTIDGKSESVDAIVNPVDWLFFKGDNEVRRYTPASRASVTKSFDYDGGDVWYGKEHGIMGRDNIVWDTPQGSGERKEKIYGHIKKGDVLADFGKK